MCSTPDSAGSVAACAAGVVHRYVRVETSGTLIASVRISTFFSSRAAAVTRVFCRRCLQGVRTFVQLVARCILRPPGQGATGKKTFVAMMDCIVQCTRKGYPANVVCAEMYKCANPIPSGWLHRHKKKKNGTGYVRPYCR